MSYRVYNDIKTATEVFDMIEDETILFIPLVNKNDGGENTPSIFMEAVDKDTDPNIIRAFIQKGDASAYAKIKERSNIYIKSTRVKTVCAGLKNLVDKKEDFNAILVLSAIDVENNIIEIETLWTRLKN